MDQREPTNSDFGQTSNHAMCPVEISPSLDRQVTLAMRENIPILRVKLVRQSLRFIGGDNWG